MDREISKREHRQQKRELKQAGNQRNRRRFKRLLNGQPDEVEERQADYGALSSAPLNGRDRDPTRRREDGAKSGS